MKKLPHRRQFMDLAAGAAALVFTYFPSQAQEWPSRPVTMVVGTAAGGGADIMARVLASRLGELLAQPFVIENIGNAVSAASRVARAPSDGYVLDFGFASTHSMHPSLYKRPVYNVITDFTPVALFAEQPYLLVTRTDFPANNLMEFAAYAKANQARMQYASATGFGSGNHLSCELINSALGIKVTLVPYRDIGPTTQDMIAGRIDYQCPLPVTMIPLIETKRVKAIATTGIERLPNLPNLPTAHEQGLTGFDVKTWFALYMPKGVPASVVQRLNEAVTAAMDTPSLQERIRAMAAVIAAPERRSPEYLQEFQSREIEKWAVPIKAAGVIVD
jgi:tripartite-type tricarboxylate transporter receptor subunit TctC